MTKNKLVVAAAGSGKTTYLINKALHQRQRKVLITTYTQANEAEIKKKIIEINKCIPENITVQTWFSFLLKHGVRPFQGCLFDKKVNGLILVNSQSGIKGYTKSMQPVYFGEEKELEQHYFSNSTKIYSDKLSKFVFRCNEKTDGAVVDRLGRIYSHIYIDEVQDLAGYDLELLKLFFKCPSEILLVGDPRQATYSTNSSSKNKQFKKSDIINFFDDPSLDIERDETSLVVNHRCNSTICNLSNKLFPTLAGTLSGNSSTTDHDGVFFVKEKDIEAYLKRYSAVQLRDSKKTKVNENYHVMNFGEAKGLSFNRVLIYPTKPFINWLKNNSTDLASTSRSKLYVALTRAKYSIGIVYDFNAKTNINGILNFIEPS